MTRTRETVCFTVLMVCGLVALAFVASWIASSGSSNDTPAASQWALADTGGSDDGTEVMGSRRMDFGLCVATAKGFVSELGDIEAAVTTTYNEYTLELPGAGDAGETIKVTCSRPAQTITVSLVQ